MQNGVTHGARGSTIGRVLENLYERPIVSDKEVRHLIGFTDSDDSQLVDRIAEIGVLEDITGQARNRRFRYRAYTAVCDEAASQSS
jgi:DNA-binding MarR family transcriptional regulator